MMSNEEDMKCPLCAEEMDWTDQQLRPCKCGYQVCVWCWHQIMDMAEKDETEGRCPACRSPYDKDKIVGTEAKFERVSSNNASRKHKPSKAKAKTHEARKDLTDIRVIQRRMAYVIGLPLSLADEELLHRKEFFGQYGKVTKVSLSRAAGGAIQQFVNDSTSVYVTFSKEEEAIRCIQSVHGFVLDGRYLRASFGTAKYCHAWLRNMPCNNAACLYLHSLGAEEDSFSKDEVAAVQTRSRVQQMIGATHNMNRCSGNSLPPPVDEQLSYSSASADKPIPKSARKDVSVDSATLNGHLTSLSSAEDKDGGARAPNKSSTFLDVVGRPSSKNGPEKDAIVAEDRRNLSGSSELSLVGIDKENHVKGATTDAMPCRKFSSSNHLGNGLPMNKEFQEPNREQLNLWGGGRADVSARDALTKELPGSVLDSGDQNLHGPCALRDDFICFGDGRLSGARSLSQAVPLLPPSHPLKTSGDSRNYASQHGETRYGNNYNVGLNTVNNNVDLASVAYASSANVGYNDKKFLTSAKSDRIYRSSNSFSSEEIVEHLRRLDDNEESTDAQNPALEALESSIISNIMSLDLDDGDDSLILNPPSAVGLFDHTDRRYGSGWNLCNNDKSLFSFTKQQSFDRQLNDLDSFNDIGHDLKKCSLPRDSWENENYTHLPLSRAQVQCPVGFSLPSREPPPGFPVYERRLDQGFNINNGSQMVKTSSFTTNHYRTPSTGNSSNTSDVDIIDPAIMVVGRGMQPNGLTNSSFDSRSSYASQPGTFDDEARLCHLLQQSSPARQDLKYPQTYMQQPPAPLLQEQRYFGQMGNRYSSWDDIYGVSSKYVDQCQTYNPSLSHQKVANGNISNGYQTGLNEIQLRNELGMGHQRNEKLGFSNVYSGYNQDYVLQPGSGDLYTRVFGM